LGYFMTILWSFGTFFPVLVNTVIKFYRFKTVVSLFQKLYIDLGR
jgi:hypothetical protein